MEGLRGSLWSVQQGKEGQEEVTVSDPPSPGLRSSRVTPRTDPQAVMGRTSDVWIRESERLIPVGGPVEASWVRSGLGCLWLGSWQEVERDMHSSQRCRLLDRRRRCEGWDVTGVWGRWRAAGNKLRKTARARSQSTQNACPVGVVCV